LPGDVKKRKAAADAATRTLDRDLREKKLPERVAPYTDKAFREAAIKWLVSTDQVTCRSSGVVIPSNVVRLQPIRALEHPNFKEMIDIAARATNGVKIPGQKGTRSEIIQMFKKHLTTLKVRLNVSKGL
jgi:hypothetical protein